MKKIVFSLLSVVAVSVNAGTVLWGSTAQIQFNGSTLNTSGAFTAYLVDLTGFNGSWDAYLSSLTSGNAISPSTPAANWSAGPQTTGGASSRGKINPTTLSGLGTSLQLGIVIVYGDYFNFSDIHTTPASDSPTPYSDSFYGSFADSATVKNIDYTTKLLDGETDAFDPSGWYKFTQVPVPEPATAGLAIAGLALLFKRRRK